MTTKKGTGIAEFDKVDAALGELNRLYTNVPDTNTKKGYDDAKAAANRLLKYRTAIEAARKKEKQPHLDRGKLIDSEAKRITLALATLEEPMKLAYKKIDEQEAELKRKRIADLQNKINDFSRIPDSIDSKSSIAISKAIEQVDDIDASGSFYELAADASKAKGLVLDRLTVMLSSAVQFEQSEKSRIKEKARADKLKVDADITDRIVFIKTAPSDAFDLSKDDIDKIILKVSSFTASLDLFGGRAQEAKDAISKSLSQLDKIKSMALEDPKKEKEEEAPLSVKPAPSVSPSLSKPSVVKPEEIELVETEIAMILTHFINKHGITYASLAVSSTQKEQVGKPPITAISVKLNF